MTAVPALSAGPPGAAPLPVLRDDLVLHEGPRARDGSPTWTLYDPAANRFFRIGWAEFEMLARWGLGTAEAVAGSVSRETPIRAETEAVADLARFVEASGLVAVRGERAVAALVERQARRRTALPLWMLKNYLFLRVPLLRPDRFLDAALPWLAWLFTPAFLRVVGLTALLGLFLVVRQWETFTHGFLHVVTPEGMLMTGAALLAAKVLHEFGHAFAAKRYGCRVPSMGVALLVLWPVLWTDTTDAWRLRSRRQRLAIDGAGIVVELALAAFASVAWVLLPDGPLRTGAYLLAGVTWIATLAVNLNPLMRFDGYFLLSDWLDVPNLQDRSFALARWRLRELLFGFGDPPPESMAASRRRWLIAYAAAVWVYRFFLFLAIALLVYHLAFKLLGLFLFVVEIVWFIVRPIWTELRVWSSRRRDLRVNRNTVLAFGMLAALVALAVVPWHGKVSAPALLRAEREAVLYAPGPGRIAGMAGGTGTAVAEGAAVFRLSSPDLDHQIEGARLKIAGMQTQIGLDAADPEMARRAEVAWQELLASAAELEALIAQRDLLTLRAHFPGVLADVPRWIVPGTWVAEGEALGILRSAQAWTVEAFAAEADLERLRGAARASFLPDDLDVGPVPLRVVRVDLAATRALAEPDLASVHGGPIAVRQGRDGELVPETPVYRVLLAPEAAIRPPAYALLGQVAVEAPAESLVGRLWRHAVAVAVRESGF
ncbi:site-2 protease family protein [Arenibaculum sp.]|jgi:putative peptide zinc metalloprotease protein|uniref:site-2 protease family protein n=1 Tax=Arenibaculum sp. TaxID=2865862 RepID=UPI002E0E3C37|nr:site-2 protease family protein [Arenibaculum sp.]